MAQKYYITTAISYPNGAPHIGHAYEFICADAIARFKRLDGYDVRFQIGTDVHGQKMFQTARDLGITPKELADKNSDAFQSMTEHYGISWDRFIRTSDEDHHRASQAIWSAMEANGDIYKDAYAGWYSVRDEAYYEEDETRLTEDGKRLGPQGSPVEWVEEESYFFRLSAYGDKLLALFDEQPDFIAPASRKNEIVSFVKGGLRDLSISRTTFDWGVKVPGDDKHVMYVWVDALTNYLTGAGYPDTESELWSYWPADLHVIGKDITRFHAVYWPAFLMSAGIDLPKRVYGHGFLLANGEKMSKSLGNVADPMDLAAEYGIDAMRYYCQRLVRFGSDGSYSHDDIVNHTNADLANNFGNLAQRSLSMIFKNCDGKLDGAGAFTEADTALLATADGMLAPCRDAIDRTVPNEALDAIWATLDAANRYFDEQAPWGLKKTDPERMATVLYVTAEVVRQVSILVQAFLPESAEKLLDQLKIPEDQRDFAYLGGDNRLDTATVIEKPEGVFPRYVEPAA
ncbi:methionine--tRNA ligase [Ahrensia sp. R2A130]|uniref:methionine--tRNA ligase n=1 Tax=Ahrensia sp. R2A130 TaxID=744979 RepID=UPI0001E0C9AF|nr:methionine--tRNA ligase [Ahrensia sp. R2A130]EFL90264.1 methionyl-tRNA synthetase [Ahrensia sp. R2A130]